MLHANRTHLVFWAPRDAAVGFAPGYVALLERFLRDVAADSHRPSSTYSLSGQYHDSQGPAAYSSRYGGAVFAADPLGASGCAEPPPAPLGSGPGWNACATVDQVESELRRVLARDRLPIAGGNVYFVVLPSGLGACNGAGAPGCALGGADDQGSWCGEHFSTGDGLLYAIIPYNAVPGHCQSGNPRPNGAAADPTISTISHEHNEMVTDPLGDAWFDGSGEEDGDLCLQDFGPLLGGSGASAFNQLIAGGRYFIQQEWSNADGGCASRTPADRVSASASSRRMRAVLTARAWTPRGRPVAYDWWFGDGRHGRGRRVAHVYARAGRYRLVLRLTDSWGQWAFGVAWVRVARR